MKKYRVVGAHAIGGHAPGETFAAELSAEHEQYLIGAGHVERVLAPAPIKEEEVKEDG